MTDQTPAADFVERLRKNAEWRNQNWQTITDPALLRAAADEITRLRAGNAELQRKLREERLKPCRHTTPFEQKAERPDLVAWQTAQSEWFDATILSIVEEYAGWRDKRDAALQRKLDEAVRLMKPFKFISDSEPRTKSGESTLVNINRCRDVAYFLSSIRGNG